MKQILIATALLALAGLARAHGDHGSHSLFEGLSHLFAPAHWLALGALVACTTLVWLAARSPLGRLLARTWRRLAAGLGHARRWLLSRA